MQNNVQANTEASLLGSVERGRYSIPIKCLWRDIDAVAIRKSLSKLSDFQSVTASPYRVLHQAQGDKQEINQPCCNHHGK